MRWGHFDLSAVLQMDFTEAEELKFALRPGDLLVCEGGEPGRAAIWDGQISPCCYQKALHRLRPVAGVVDARFLMYRLRLGQLIGEFVESHGKTTIAHLPAVRLAGIEITLPPFLEQRRIAATLEAQLAATERARRAAEASIEAAGSVIPAMLARAFSDGLAATTPHAPLGTVLTLRREVVHPRNYPSGDAVFVGLEHIESGTNRRVGELRLKLEELSGRKPAFRKGDVVYGYLRPYLNKAWVAQFDGLCSVDQYVFKVDPSRADPRYVAWFMRSPAYLRLAKVRSGPGQLPRIRVEEVMAVEIPFPSLDAQRLMVESIETAVVAAQAAVTAANSELGMIDALPAALLHRAFSGDL